MDPQQQYQQYNQRPQNVPQAPQTKGQVAVARANKASDYAVLAVTIVGFSLVLSGYFIYQTLKTMSSSPWAYGLRSSNLGFVEVLAGILAALVVAAIMFGVILGLGMFIVRMQRQQMLGNSLHVEYSAYAWLRDWANEVAADLELPRVEIFVTQNPLINAYAFGFARPYTIVLNSGSIRYLTDEELKVVVLHEMAHIKYHHTDANIYLAPFMTIPASSWFAGFWRRRAEFTADRLALMYLGDSDLVKNALIKVHVGPDVAEDMNEIARQWLQYNAERPMNRFSQTFSDHPFLVRRLSQIDLWKGVVEPAESVEEAKTSKTSKNSTKTKKS